MSESELVALVDISKEYNIDRSNLTKYVSHCPYLFPGGSFVIPVKTPGGIQMKRVITRKDSVTLIEKAKHLKKYKLLIPEIGGAFMFESYLNTYISDALTKNKITYNIEFETGELDCRCDFLIRSHSCLSPLTLHQTSVNKHWKKQYLC